MKIGDYGVSTQIYKEDYYFTEEAVALPIRWSSPETLNVSESVIETKKVINRKIFVYNFSTHLISSYKYEASSVQVQVKYILPSYVIIYLIYNIQNITLL